MVKQRPKLKYRDIVKKLKKLGFIAHSERSRGKGSHEIRIHSDGRQTVVPKHGNKDISLTVIKGICQHTKTSQELFYGL